MSNSKKDQSYEDFHYDEKTMFAKASEKKASVTSFPLKRGGELLAVSESNSVQPGGTVTWYLNGPTGSQFRTTLRFEGGGGHSHGSGSTEPIAAGTINPASGTLSGSYPQNLLQTFRAGEVCGRIKDTTTIGGETLINNMIVAQGSYQALSGSTGVVSMPLS